jgi:hypothetical protein
MTETFICAHCQRKSLKNPRLKVPQRYCGLKECQQARKNSWERNQLKKDAGYKNHRKAVKRRWYQCRPGDRYQSAYRETHPDYCEANRAGQRERNQKRRKKSPSSEKIVKTDALPAKTTVGQGLYVLLPYDHTDAKKIVNTDALIVQMIASTGITGGFFPQSSG